MKEKRFKFQFSYLRASWTVSNDTSKVSDNCTANDPMSVMFSKLVIVAKRVQMRVKADL